MADKKMLPKMVKEEYLKISLTKLYNVMEKSVEIIQWSENKGSAAEDGFTTELVAVKGTANITNKMQNFSFMIKLTPEIGHRVNMVKEVKEIFIKVIDHPHQILLSGIFNQF